jgi:Uma2 family endonuclease
MPRLPPRAEDLPTMYELPSEDPEEPGLPDDFHYYQLQLLRETFGRVSGSYKVLALEDRRRWLPEADLGLGIWEGAYEGIHGQWRRWLDAEGR